MPHVSSFLHEAPGGVTDTVTESSFGLVFADFGATLKLQTKPSWARTFKYGEEVEVIFGIFQS